MRIKSEILKNYELSFVDIVIYGEKWKHCSVRNDKIQKTLGCFLSSWQKLKRIDRLLEEIDMLLQGNISDIATGCDAVLIDAYKEQTEFYDVFSKPDFNTADLVIPTTDFKLILMAWKGFLTEPAKEKYMMVC